MHVWLLHIGEDLPVDGEVRKYRYGYLADALVARGHSVVRWAPTFRHTTKTHRFKTDCRIEINPRYHIEFLHTNGYRRNVGFSRLWMNRALGMRLRAKMAGEAPPDIIVAAIPSLEWADAATAYGRSRGIPVVVDVRDVWPDVFYNALPRATRPAGRLLFAPYRRLARRACRGATAITGVSQEYVDWALRLAGRRAAASDLVMPLGFDPPATSSSRIAQHVNQLRDRGIDPQRPSCFFAGLFERSYDLETVVRAARVLDGSGQREIQFLLCGDGAKLPVIRRLAEGLDNVHLLGWVAPAMLQAAASIASIGLCAYAVDATQSLPNKPFEYMAGELAVVSSLQGELATILERQACGLTYQAGNSQSLSDALQHLLQHRTRLRAMQVRARATWAENYRSSEIYQRFVQVLESRALPTRCAA